MKEVDSFESLVFFWLIADRRLLTANPMNIVQLTPGTGSFHCGTCLRDHAVVKAMRRMGHSTLLVPLYLPFVTDGDGAKADSEIFYGGVNVFLEQKFSLFRHTPRWMDRLFNSKWMLKFAAKMAGSTDSKLLGPMTISMLRGEEGRQAKELEKLIDWLKTQPKPDVLCLSNGLLVGMARRLKEVFKVPVVCLLQGEDAFLNAMGKWTDEAWATAAARSKDVDAFIPVSQYYGDLMATRLQLRPERVHVVHNGISLEGFHPHEAKIQHPTIGFFARMIPGKGLHLVIDAFLALKRQGHIPNLKLKVGGAKTDSDDKFVQEQQAKIAKAGFVEDVTWSYNVTFEEKLEFLRGITLLSVPTTYGESFGLYILEALASGVPVVQPRSGAFTELVEATGGGVLCEPDNAVSLAAAMEPLLMNDEHARRLGEQGRQAVHRDFNVDQMAAKLLDVYGAATRDSQSV